MGRNFSLNKWLNLVLKNRQYHKIQISGDASFRSYYRILLDNGEQYILMDAPPPESPQLFMDIAKILKKTGLSVPSIFASDIPNGFLLLSDFGDRLYLNELNDNTANTLYQDALNALIQIQKIKTNLPLFDKTLLKNQLELFYEWYLKTHLKLDNIQAIRNSLDRVLDNILQIIIEQPFVFVHRDYHSRNLMILNQNNPGILDFQDAIYGPITYDLVSLFQDCYISWPRNRVLNWLEEYQQLAKSASLLTGVSTEKFLCWFDFTGLQRHLKNLGIFARLYHRDGKAQYLKALPLVLKYIVETCEQYTELMSFSSFFKDLKRNEEALCVQCF